MSRRTSIAVVWAAWLTLFSAVSATVINANGNVLDSDVPNSNVPTRQALTVGVAAVDITPPIGFRIGGGYGEMISTGIEDPLMAKAMVLRQGSRSAAIVISDLLSVPPDLSRLARFEIARRTGVAFDHIIIAATHNHGSPEYWGSIRDIHHHQTVQRRGKDPHESIDYQSKLVAQWIKAANEADQASIPTSIQCVVARPRGLAFNRRFHMRDGSVRTNPGRANPDIIRPAGPIDPDAITFLFSGTISETNPLASLTSFALHTAVWNKRRFSGDFPGVVEQTLRAKFDDSFVSIFAEGAAGDINHVDVGAANPPPESVLVETIGRGIADAIVSGLPTAKTIGRPDLAVLSRTIGVPFKGVGTEAHQDDLQTLADYAARRTDFTTAVKAWRDCHRYHHSQTYAGGELLGEKPIEIQAIRVDDEHAIISMPHEVFVEIGLAIQSASPFQTTMIVTLANDVDYYIPTGKAFVEGGYEVTTCPLEPGCGEIVQTTAIELLHELKMMPIQ